MVHSRQARARGKKPRWYQKRKGRRERRPVGPLGHPENIPLVAFPQRSFSSLLRTAAERARNAKAFVL